MRIHFLIAFLVIVCGLSQAADKHYAQVEEATHKIVVSNMLRPDSKAHCSGTAIGKRAFFTAGHCGDNGDSVTIDGETVNVVASVNDGHDHLILLLSEPVFTKYVTLSPQTLEPSDEVFIVGNPDSLKHQFRRGYVSGTDESDDDDDDDTTAKLPVGTLIDINGFFGDSGAGVFNSEGCLVNSVSLRSQVSVGDKAPFVLMEVFDVKFTEAQMKLVKEFE